ncbi:37738_t:CDS:1 [Gigaspora margarita]|uniref:37738_t:CDS:1 n=1 Tax=Gigaspora margarita TaxID=4874 RepID=A0ABN7X9N0_GIGMA|nr:37738_t:CDS:1 [Gigaspora margarita]
MLFVEAEMASLGAKAVVNSLFLVAYLTGMLVVAICGSGNGVSWR